MTFDILKIVLISSPALIAGALIGNWIHKKIPKEKLKKIIFGLLILSGIMLLKAAFTAGR